MRNQFIVGGGGQLEIFPLPKTRSSSNYCVFCNSQSKCVSSCNVSPDVDKGILNAVLSSHNVYLAIPPIFSYKGSPLLFLQSRYNFDQASQKKLKTQSYMANLIPKMPNRGKQLWCPNQKPQSTDIKTQSYATQRQEIIC